MSLSDFQIACMADIRRGGRGGEMGECGEETSAKAYKEQGKGNESARTLLFSLFPLLIKYAKPSRL